MADDAGVSGAGRALPGGEVTFVFTDIEGSTRLLRELGDRYVGVLARHRELLEGEAVAGGGVVVDAEGDALFIAFTDAASALRACVRGHQALAVEQWSNGVQVRVRTGLHTGDAAPVQGRYAALAVHQAARIAAAGHGGQIVLSDATLDAASDVTFGVLRDLGQHYLKDFDEPVRLWQLTAPGAPADFADLRTGHVSLPLTHSAPPRLVGAPAQWTSFVGREVEKHAAVKALSEARLVTLLGPGGVGKSRLSIEVAGSISGEFEHGAMFVELVPVRPGFLGQAVAAALEVRGRVGQATEESVVEHLATRHALVVLDNCEHVLPEVVALTTRILRGCPRVTLLTTSRERLGVPGERVLGVPPLGRASAEAPSSPSEAVRLFLDRAQDADAGFDEDTALVAELCDRLDGMPLAIELAAARAASLGVSGLLAGLGDRLRLLAGGQSADERHRSLRSVLDWSHSLLTDEEARFLERLGIFVNGFDLEAAAQVAADGEAAAAADLLGRLADKSLLVRQRGSVPRWRLLETVRTYAIDRLNASDAAAGVRSRHLAWAAAAARDIESRLDSDPLWRTAFDGLADDLRAVISYDIEPQTVHGVALSTGRIAFAYRFFDEAKAHLDRAAELAPDPVSAITAVREAADVCQANVWTDASVARLLRAAEIAAAAGLDGYRASCLAQAVIAAIRFPAGMRETIPPERLAELLDEARQLAPKEDLLAHAYLEVASAWMSSLNSSFLTVEAGTAQAALTAARAADDPVLISSALDAVMSDLLGRGRTKAAFDVARDRVASVGQLSPHDPRATIERGDTFHMYNEMAVAAGELPSAVTEMRRLQHDEASVFVGYGAASRSIPGLVLTGRMDEAARHADAMWAGWQASGSPTARWMTPYVLTATLTSGLRGDQDAAAEWLRRTQEVVGDVDMFEHQSSASCAAFVVGRIEMHAGRHTVGAERTRAFRSRVGAWYTFDSHWNFDAYVWALDAELAVLAHATDADDRLVGAAPAGVECRWAHACLLRAHGRRQNNRQLLDQSIAAWEDIDARFERACTLLLLADRAEEGVTELHAIGATLPK
ncbi:MAG: hypothetical protein ABR571_11770 [Jatrophihabitans sp.]|uniref:ATP-binding protein n=1 Tax=Jatrophihabitans sp. TaxID=1932789 RepID=UPI00390FC634